VIRDHLYEAMSEFGIPTKLIRLCRMTLTNTTCAVKIGADLSSSFDTKCGFRQGDTLSCDFFNLTLEKIVRAANINTTGTIFYKSVMLLAYADDIIVMGRAKHHVATAYSKLIEIASQMGLEVNEDKTKYLATSTKDARDLGQHVAFNGYTFEVVKDFVYLGTSINTNNDVSMEIKRRITLANRCYYGLSRQLRSKAFSRRTKLTLYKSLILPVLLYGAEAWTLNTKDERMLGAFERKLLRKIYGPICVNSEYRIRWNHELYADNDLVKKIKIQQLRC